MDVDLTKKINFLLARLLDHFRSGAEPNAWFEAALIAEKHLQNATTKKKISQKKIIYFASTLKNNITAKSLRDFAAKCLESAYSDDLLHKKPKAEKRENVEKDLSRKIKLALEHGHHAASATQRAANALYAQYSKMSDQKKRDLSIERHPLREVFEAQNLPERTLCKEDVRSHLLKLGQWSRKNQPGTSMLYRILDKAKVFSQFRLHSLLGDELFFLCRPLGFFDKNDSIVLVEVPSNAHLHALSYRKLEIMRALKKDAHFAALRELRFKVKHGT